MPQEAPAQAIETRLIRRPEVERITGLSRSSIYEHAATDPTWPGSVRIGPGTVAWVESEVRAWVEQKIQARGRRS